MTRGIINNNPLNIRLTDTNWEGKIAGEATKRLNGESEFEQFISMYYGFRAALKTIETYIIQHGCNTIRAIINRWAPASDGNNTENYIRYVCHSTGIGGNEPISNHDKRLKGIVAAMAVMESGQQILDYMDSLDRAFDEFTPREIVYNKNTKMSYPEISRH